MEIAAIPFCIHDDKENVPPFPAYQMGLKQADVRPCLRKKGVVVGQEMVRKPLGDITRLFVGGSIVTRSSSARASSDLPMLHCSSRHPKKRRALDDVDLLRVVARSAKSLRMGFR